MRVGIITAVYGDYDEPHPLPTQVWSQYEAFLVTDNKFIDVSGWETIYEPDDRREPRRAAKFPKCQPHLYFPEADITIWVDGHLEIRSPDFIRTLVEDLGDAPLGQFPHTQHRTLTAEAALAKVTGKYKYDVDAQAAHYLERGMPDDYGVWMTGLIVRRYDRELSTGDHELIGKDWLAEMDRWGVEDQISQPWVLWQHQLKPHELPFEGWWDGRRFALHQHADGSM